jgi:hypothetical protein
MRSIPTVLTCRPLLVPLSLCLADCRRGHREPHTRRHATRVLAVIVCCFIQAGCLTPLVISAYEDAPRLEAARLGVIEASPTSIRLAWETTYEGSRSRSGEISLNPHLDGCAQVGVSIRGADELLHDELADFLVASSDTGEHPPPTVSPGSCDVVILVSKGSAELLLDASNSAGSLGHARIDAPRNHLWLTLVPLTATVDAVGAVGVAVAGAAAFVLEGMAGSDQAQTWTWTP